VWILSAVLVVLVLVLTPPLIGVNRLRHRVTASMSRSLGRPVAIDSIELNLLPVPGFTLQNLVVSEDPAFGDEPVIRANSVRARLRVSSLWRRQVEFSTIRFEDPSVNLVRRADGRWNVENILLHATEGEEEAAPTEQSRPGPKPRFPYVEATGARVNVKRGAEKLPLALTEVDFALWLPSPRQWRLRLKGKPTRTDVTVSDVGVLAVEASLERSSQLGGVPLEASVEWTRAPLGEASRLLAGNDAGWRGYADVTATAHGTFGDAILSTQLRLTDVRRADFIPAHRMDLSVDCTAHLAIAGATLTEPACTLPTTDSAGTGEGTIAATADTVQLAGFEAQGLRIGMTGVPDTWFLNWARLLSERIPAMLSARGSVSGSVAQVRQAGAKDATWQGGFQGTMGGEAGAQGAAATPLPAQRTFEIVPGGDGLVLAPLNIAMGDKAAPLLLTGTANAQRYTMHVSGTATPQQLDALRGMVPPLADGTDALFPAAAQVGSAPVRVELACSRAWGTEQTCVAMRAAETEKKPPKRRRR
jgi:AsmA protein